MPTNVLDFPDPLLTEYLARQSEVFDLSEAAAFLKSSEHEVLRLVREQGLPARAVGDGWRFLKGAICRWLGSAQPPQSDREALLAGAGIFQDDPDLSAIVAEAMRLRGRGGNEDE